MRKLGVCAGTPKDACRDADQFKCYGVSGGDPSVQSLTYTDRFGNATVATAKAKHACNPAADLYPLEDAGTHLTCKGLLGTRAPLRTLDMRDRFGTGTLTLSKPALYCAPSVEPGMPGKGGVDEFACYKARGGAHLGNTSLALQEEFATTNATRVMRAKAVCVPATRDGSAPKDPKRLLTCYSVHDVGPAALASHTVTLASGLGSETLKTTKPKLFCVPSTIEPCARLVFAGVQGSPSCGGPELEPEAEPPFVGALFDATVGGNEIGQLGTACTYFGGGDSEYYPASQNAGGGSSTLEATSCGSSVLDLTASASSDPAACALGPAEVKVCLNNTALGCTTDADCHGPVGNCAPAPRCFAAPPQPFRSSVASVCVS